MRKQDNTLLYYFRNGLQKDYNLFNPEIDYVRVYQTLATQLGDSLLEAT